MSKEKRKHILVDIETHKKVKELAAKYENTLGGIITILVGNDIIVTRLLGGGKNV